MEEAVGGRELFDSDLEQVDHQGDSSTSSIDSVDEFFCKGCGCKKDCCKQFLRDEILESRLGCAEMKYYCNSHVNHHHVFVSGILNALMRTGSDTIRGKDRKHQFLSYQFRGVQVCQNFFMFVMNVGEKELKNLKKRLSEGGVAEGIHGNVGKAELNRSLPSESRERAIKFIRLYGMQHGLVLPGRIPAFRKYKDLIVLPSTLTKLVVYLKYETALGEEVMGQSTWYKLWTEFCSNVVVHGPRTDLCVNCQNSIVPIGQLQGMSEEVKKKKIEKSLQHLTLVQDVQIDDFQENLPLIFCISPCTDKPLLGAFSGFMHYSFDYAQQIFIPHDSRQVGPLYFLVGYKVGLFGVAIEPLKKFILYIIPESCAVGKGSNSVISFLHHAIENFSVGEQHAVFHADNCVGQNKNNFMLQYLMHRVMSGKLKSATINHLHLFIDLYQF